MSELNINDLPEEMLINVFRLLDAANLKNATLTCKLWKNLIESACRWSLNLKLNHNTENGYNAEQKVNFLLATNRKFKIVGIIGCRLKEGSQALEIFRKHGLYVVKLKLWGVQIDNIIDIAEILNFTPNLKYVDIRVVRLKDISDVPDQNIPNLKKLTKFQMLLSNYRIIQCFRKAKPTTIKIYECDVSKHPSTLATLAHFILSQDILTSLTAEPAEHSPSVLAEIGKLDFPIPFRLTRLAISHMGSRNSPQDHNLLKFVKSQASSLTEMEIGEVIPSSVYECVFASMTNLNSLGVTIDDVPRDNEFYERLQENGNVCTMKILNTERESFYDLQYFGNFLKKLPNIRNLFLSRTGCSYKNILVAAAQHLGQLEFLHMSLFDGNLSDDIGRVNFPNLKVLQIEFLRFRIDWIEFTKTHSRLVELTIKDIRAQSFLTMDIDHITTNVDLQSLKLGVGFWADDRFFEIIRIKCPNLKVLDLHKSCVSHGMNHNNENKLLRLVDVLEGSTYSQMLFNPNE